MFRCDYCGREGRGQSGSVGPTGWLMVQKQGEFDILHFCSHSCLVLHGHDLVDYKTVPGAERLRTALQSLGLLPRIDRTIAISKTDGSARTDSE